MIVCIFIKFIDASGNEGFDGEEYFEDEENFDQVANQGKPSYDSSWPMFYPAYFTKFYWMA